MANANKGPTSDSDSDSEIHAQTASPNETSGPGSPRMSRSSTCHQSDSLLSSCETYTRQLPREYSLALRGRSVSVDVAADAGGGMVIDRGVGARCRPYT